MLLHRRPPHKDKPPGSVRRFLRRVALSSRRRRQMSTAAINLALYAALAVAYFFVVLRWLNEPLARLFQEDLVRYAVVAVLLILGQGLLLDIVAANLLRLAKRLSRRQRE